ncbi:MAG: 5-(carboxyamino)imidazole ribonucleotide synthase [Candidatus Eremiobacteraeota bacterium]|nr:5-(carboxyamino)imidazole ribonucleotide synthase [Candidatus Eremiobacteraeota bacterium]
MIQTIGVIGGGQLGRMFALDAKRMGYDVIVLDPTPNSPTGQVADEQLVAPYDNMEMIDRLGDMTDVVTYEFENIAIASVQRLERKGKFVAPSSKVLAITQDRLQEKRFLKEAGIGVAPFAAITRVDDITAASHNVAFPAVVKTVRGGYDGKGQWRVDGPRGVQKAFAEVRGETLIMERYIPFVKELSVVATRNARDQVVCFPVTENVHDQGILTMSIAPARINEELTKKARAATAAVGRKLEIVGTYCVEYFLTPQGELLANEIAPRPHNSGHYTIDATPCSQYEQHIRAICDLPLSPPRLLSRAVMMNILGDGKGNHLAGIENLLTEPGLVLHMYGKKHAVARRKMGHFTLLCAELQTGIEKAKASLAKLHWEDIVPAAAAPEPATVST